MNQKLTNQDALVPISLASLTAGSLSLIQVFLSPQAPIGSFYWKFYFLLFCALFIFGLIFLFVSRIPFVRSLLPIPAAVILSFLTAGLASVDSIVTRDMSALVLGLIGGTITLRTRISFHFLRNVLTISLYLFGVKFLSGHFPSTGDLINALVHLTIAMLVAFVLEQYANRAFHLQNQLERRNGELLEISIKDKLTGLYNRRFIDETLEKVLAICRRQKAPFSVILLDIDFFKRINDEYGHATGDTVLVGIASTLSGSIRSSDILGRIGGEEFLLILPETNLSGACRVAENVLETVRKCTHEGVSDRITISAGVAEWEKEEQLKTLLHRADALLYKAKNNGRNCFYSSNT